MDDHDNTMARSLAPSPASEPADGNARHAEGTVTDFASANDNGRRCYRITFDNEGPVIYTYLPAPWDIELIPIGR